MRHVEREPRPVVVEYRWFPGRRCVAGSAVFLAPRGLELAAVGVFGRVAAEAPVGSAGECGSGLHRGCVALNAPGVLMGALQAERGGGVVERARGAPLLRGVASLASELSLVRVAVARSAIPCGEMVLARLTGAKVALAARYRRMSAGQREPRLLVARG